MQTLTFTQKLLRQRSFFNFLIPLFAVFVGLGASQTAQAQVTITSTSVIIQRNGGSNETFNVSPSTPMPFNGTNLGSYDINTGQLSLKGGTVTTNETGTVAATAASLNYRVFDFNFNLLTSGSIVLQGGAPTNGNRTFTTSGANIDLVNIARPIGVGTPYYLAVNFSTQQRMGLNVSDGPKDDNGGNQYAATYSITNTPPAQVSTATLRNVIVTSGTTAANATTTTYDATATTPGPGVFNGTNFGSFDASAGRLLLQGGSIQIAERNGDTFDKALIDFVVSPGDLSSTFVSTDQTLQLVQTGYNVATMTRTFSLTNAARNVLALAMTGGAGTSYRFDVSVSASGNNSVGNGISIQGLRQRSVFTVTGTPVVMPTLTNTTVFVSPSNGPNVTYDANNVSANLDFDGANLGTFDISSGQLVLNGGGATTTENGPNQVSNVTLYFRVRQTGTGGGGYTPLALTQTGITTNAGGSRTRTFVLDNAARNLLADVTAVGGYNVDAYLEASGINTSTNAFFVITDRTNVTPYTANFTVNGTPVVTTVWTGGFNDNWFDTRNWTEGIPNANKNALIPNLPSGNVRPYPNIYSDAVKPPSAQSTSTNPNGTVDIIPASPGFNNLGSGNAMARNLILQGSTQLDRSILRLIVGRLDVFGDFNNPQGSFIQRQGSIISFKAQGNQTISGSTNGFTNVEIDGGVNSIKTLVENFNIVAGGTLRFINGILQTDIGRVGTNFVELEGSTTNATTTVVTPSGRIIGETEVSWLRGFIKTRQLALVGVPQDFGNIGMTLNFLDNDPGNTLVTRTTGGNIPETAFAGSALNPNANPRPSIRRIFGVQPANAATQTRALTADLQFRYLSNELVNVRRFNDPNDMSTTNLDQNKLSLYVSQTGNDSFNQLGRESNSDNVLIKRGVTTFATFTLSEAAVLPLPVTLTYFDAKRMGADALITWETASEINSKGFEVQVSTDGKEFRTLGSVASASPNSAKKTSYRYVDTETNKVGTRYYRLRQIDTDGKDAFFAPRTVLFTGNVLATAMVAYPNPIVGSELRLVLQSVAAGKGTLRITDMTGRVIRQESVELTSGTSDLSVKALGDLKSGMYLVGVTLPTGVTQNLKIVKQ